jgi:dsDNA-specific endonuclease/ATPase MutS2
LNGKVKKVVFIHGVGQGKLKYEITRILHDKYPDLKYQDASFKEYGYGATMILL